MTWPRSLEAILKSGDGAAGIDAEALGGGSAAGWRGSGFVLPSPKEAAALRADAMGHFTNPFDLTKEMQSLLQSGRTTLRRRPNQPFSQAMVTELLQPQHDNLRMHLLDLRKLLRTGSGIKDRSGTPTPLMEASKNIAEKEIMAAPYSDDLLESARAVLHKVGTYISVLEKADVAVSLDFDGSASDTNEYAELVANARLLTQEFAQLKKDLHDRATNILGEVQDAVTSTFEPRINKEDAETILSTVDDFLVSSNAVQDALHKLAEVAAEQQRLAGKNIAARAKVYGVVDLPAPPVNSPEKPAEAGREARGDDSASGGGMLYLGPGIAVPDGPDDRGPPRALGARQVSGGARGRSASTATSGSSALRRGTDGSGLDGVAEDGSFKSPRSDKIKKIFGDEAPAHDLEAAAKRVEADPWFLEVDYSPNDIVLTSEGQVKGATLGALMERLTMHNNFGECLQPSLFKLVC